eukprot:COSAG02_NODE_11490_length_1714_cov_1.388235_2_plen_128_part_00
MRRGAERARRYRAAPMCTARTRASTRTVQKLRCARTMPYPTATPESQGLDSSRLAKLTVWQEQMVADGKLRSKPRLALRVVVPSERETAGALRVPRAAAASCPVPRLSWHAVGRSCTASLQARQNLA